MRHPGAHAVAAAVDMPQTLDHARVVLELWRTASRQAALEDALARALQVASQALPLRAVALAHADGPSLTPLGFARGLAEARTEGARRPAPVELAAVKRLLAGARVCAGELPDVPALAPLAADGADGSFLLCALESAEEILGIALFLASPGASFTRGDLALAERLLEPLTSLVQRELAQVSVRPAHSHGSPPVAPDTTPEPGTPAGSIVGEHQGLRPVMDFVLCVAPTDVPVLILGETGSGKEVIARAIHERSARADGPMVKVNCGAIPPELVDSELFGHERGSFTGAVAARKGWFERADSGTLFLDEVGELPLAAQVRLLRVLQDGIFERVGGQRPVSVNVRIVAATHRDLSHLAATGDFRRDLWYRLSVFPIHLPPLRDRAEDVRLLAAHFAASAGRRLFGAPLAPSESDLALLCRHTWPGNVRELAAVIDRAALLGGGRGLDVAAALELTQYAPAPTSSPTPTSPDRAVPLVAANVSATRTALTSAVRPLETVVIEAIENALLATSGRIEGPNGAAALLGINPHTLRARMRKLGIDWVRFRSQPRSSDDPH